MTGPGDSRPAAARGHGYLRAGHADRDQTVSVLKAAFVQGRLTRDELELRLGQALTSRTYADLHTLTADLPAGIVPATPPAPAGDADHRAGVRVIAGLTALCTYFWLAVALRASPGADFFGGSLFFVLMVLIVVPGIPAALFTLHARMEKRASQQLPPGRPPGRRGRSAPRTGPPPRGRQHPPAGPRYMAYLPG